MHAKHQTSHSCFGFSFFIHSLCSNTIDKDVHPLAIFQTLPAPALFLIVSVSSKSCHSKCFALLQELEVLWAPAFHDVLKSQQHLFMSTIKSQLDYHWANVKSLNIHYISLMNIFNDTVWLSCFFCSIMSILCWFHGQKN